MSRHTLALAVLPLTSIFFGCAVGPDFVAPEVELADSFVEAAPGSFVAGPVTMELWRSLEEAELDALIERALAENTTIAQALATLSETRALSGLAVYSWFPTVGVGVSGERSQPSAQDPFNPPDVQKTDTYRAGFDMADRKSVV